MTSYHFSLSPKDRKVGRFLGKVRRELQKAFSEERDSQKLSQADIARALGVHRSVINRQLVGTENLTLSRVAELAWAMGRELDFSLVKPKLQLGINSSRNFKVDKPNTPSSDLKFGEVTASSSADSDRRSDYIFSQAA